tara:strand:- start:232 stop:1200 length:969 start_codon:yes stop_codon:yes gene_type:complete
MNWDYWINRYIHNYCVVRGLTSESIKTYEGNLHNFQEYMVKEKRREGPRRVKISEIFDYLEYLKVERGNGQASINKVAAIIKVFYAGLVSLGHLEYYENPMRDFRRMKSAPSKMRDILSRKEAKRLLKSTDERTVLGVRDRAMILLLYTTGIRSSELCQLKEKDVDLNGYLIRVLGKGQKERLVPLNEETVRYLKKYKKIRGDSSSRSPFFKTRLGSGVTRKGLYDRIKKYVLIAGIRKRISAHNLRHSFATDLLNKNVNIVTVQKLLGHRNITSTMRYLRITIEDLREAVKRHPISEFSDILHKHLGDVRLPYQLSRSGFS